MTSSTSSSSRPIAGALALLAAVSALACAGPDGRGHGRPPIRVAVLPVHNLSGAVVPTKELLPPIARALARGGVDVVEGEPVEQFLSRHRMRYTGGIGSRDARDAARELGVDAVLITSVELYGSDVPPKLAISMRLVSAGVDPAILWMDGAFMSGDESPGILGLGRIRSIEKLQRKALSSLTDSLAHALRRGLPSVRGCDADRRFDPIIVYAEPRLEPGKRYSVAVLPFVDHTIRRGAGEIVALETARQLATVPALRVLEPGVVRERSIRQRIVTEGGISRETARLLRGSLEVDLVMSGVVFSFSEGSGTPKVEFDTVLLDARNGEVVWESTSKSSGDEGVVYAHIGAVSTASDLACRMASVVADGIARRARSRGPIPREEPAFGAGRR